MSALLTRPASTEIGVRGNGATASNRALQSGERNRPASTTGFSFQVSNERLAAAYYRVIYNSNDVPFSLIADLVATEPDMSPIRRVMFSTLRDRLTTKTEGQGEITSDLESESIRTVGALAKRYMDGDVITAGDIRAAEKVLEPSLSRAKAIIEAVRPVRSKSYTAPSMQPHDVPRIIGRYIDARNLLNGLAERVREGLFIDYGLSVAVEAAKLSF